MNPSQLEHFNIPDPCPADWDKMTPTEQGRHCEHCDKEVTDLSKANFLEIQRKAREKAGDLCMVVDERRVNYTGPQRMFFRRMRRFAIAAMLVFGSSLFSFASPAQASECEAILTEFVGTDDDTKSFQGRAFKDNSDEALVFVRVIFYVDGDKVSETMTDETGAFTAELPYGEDGQELTIKFKSKDFYSKTNYTIGSDITFDQCLDLHVRPTAKKEKKVREKKTRYRNSRHRMMGAYAYH